MQHFVWSSPCAVQGVLSPVPHAAGTGLVGIGAIGAAQPGAAAVAHCTQTLVSVLVDGLRTV